MAVSIDYHPASTVGTVHDELTDREVRILQATKSNSVSTVALAEVAGFGHNISLVVPILERLEELDLLDGFFAAGRSTSSPLEIHRRYYRLSERGQRLI